MTGQEARHAAEQDGRVFLVTGGTQGIGAACVARLAAEGAKVVFTGRDRSAAAAVMAVVPRATFVAGDVSSEADCVRAVDAALEIGRGKIAGLVNNAGISARMAFEDTTLADWNRTVTVNAHFGLSVYAPCVAGLRGAGGRLSWCRRSPGWWARRDWRSTPRPRRR